MLQVPFCVLYEMLHYRIERFEMKLKCKRGRSKTFEFVFLAWYRRPVLYHFVESLLE